MTTTTTRHVYRAHKGTRGQTRVTVDTFLDLLDAMRDAARWSESRQDRFSFVWDTDTDQTMARYNMQTTAVISEMRS